MYIREIKKQHRNSEHIYIYHRLIELVRTPQGPRQRIVLNLGRLDIPLEEWKTLANRIETVAGGQKQLDGFCPDHIEALARKYAVQLQHKREKCVPAGAEIDPEKPLWERVDLHAVTSEECRTVGGESVVHEAFNQLGFPEIFSDLGFEKHHREQAELLIVSRALHPGSERETARWAKENSALGELLNADFRHLSNNALYRISDRLLNQKPHIEMQVAENEKQYFGLGEKIILYDLTSTFLTGTAPKSETLAKRGRSKQKRNDCPLLTLALVLDEDGFPKGSRVFPGNAGEPAALKKMVSALSPNSEKQRPLSISNPTIVMDAGIAAEANLKWIRSEGFHYICVSRSRPTEGGERERVFVNEKNGRKVHAKRIKNTDEIRLYCESDGRKAKEASMRTPFQKRFEEGLEAASAALTKNGGTKKYDKVLERIGRLKERYPAVARFYKVDVSRKEERADTIKWRLEKPDKADLRFSGSYYLRSDRKDLNEKELRQLYGMLTRGEDSFRIMKTDLGFRPVFHQKDNRMEGRLFISVLACHLIAFFQKKLGAAGISHRWKTIRNSMAAQARITVSMTNDQNKRIHIRQATEPEPFHLAVHRAMGLPVRPMTTTHYRI